MADKKRKTLQIKRPDANSVKSKKKPLPKVRMDEKTATSAVDTDELASMGPKTAKLKRPDETLLGNKGKTTRIALPDEEKIRKARRANATQDLGEENALPSAEQIEMAQKNATMPIMIDTENVEDNSNQSLNDTDSKDAMDRTMEIDAEALATSNLEKELKDASTPKGNNDQTMKIDDDALATGNIQNVLADADAAGQDARDQTMKIDEDALATGNLKDALEDIDAEKSETPDQTMQINAEALATGDLQNALADADAPAEDARDQTMQIDPEALATGNVDPVNDEAIMSMETMQMEPIDEFEESSAADETPETDLTVEEMKESFNAQTMEMDPSMLADELAKKNSAQLDDADVDVDRSKTMDLSESRPKTIMIKRPSKRAPASSSTPTVKAVRPDAVTVRTSRPVTANTAQPKQDTSRIDVPGEAGSGGKEGKTIKLRRPSGAPAARSKSTISRVAGNAGLSVNDDGTVTAIPKADEALGAPWLAVAVISFLISAGAAYTLYAQSNSELYMPGRLVDSNNQLIEQTTP